MAVRQTSPRLVGTYLTYLSLVRGLRRRLAAQPTFDGMFHPRVAAGLGPIALLDSWSNG